MIQGPGVTPLVLVPLHSGWASCRTKTTFYKFSIMQYSDNWNLFKNHMWRYYNFITNSFWMVKFGKMRTFSNRPIQFLPLSNWVNINGLNNLLPFWSLFKLLWLWCTNLVSRCLAILCILDTKTLRTCLVLRIWLEEISRDRPKTLVHWYQMWADMLNPTPRWIC
jgi:hypothetical protein